MRSRGEILLRAAAWALALTAPVRAQVLVQGRVLDENNAPVPSAQVELRETAGSGAVRGAVSDEFGRFRAELPAAGVYSVQARKDGFFVLKESTAQFAEGLNSLTVTLNHLRELVETVDVVYSPPAIDPTETAERKQLNNMQILEVPFPASQDFRNALPMFPGVTKDRFGQLHFYGGASDQTSYTLDGFNIADVYTGSLEARVSIDAVRSLDLSGSRFAPDKGPGSAGALEIVTGMGDDRLRFGATNFIPGISMERGLVVNKWTPRLTVSGPLSRGRAWFHNGFDAFYDVDTVRELPRGQDRSRSVTAGNLSRVQWNLTPSHILTANLLVNFTETDHYGLSFLNPIETTLHQRRRLYLGAIKDQFYLPNRGLFEFGFAATRGSNANAPQGNNTYIISPSGFRGNHFDRFQRDTAREQWIFAVTLPLSAGGKHEWKIGADFQRRSFEQTSARHDFRILREDGTLARWVQFPEARRLQKSNFETAVYARDRWQLRENLSVSAGLRADWNQIARDPLLSPRLSAAWSPGFFWGIKATAGFGIYNDALNLDLLTRHQDQCALVSYYSRTGAPFPQPVTLLLLNPEQNLRTPRARVYSLGLERMLAGGVHLSLGYTRKRGWDGFAFDGPSCGLISQTSLCILNNRRRDRYDAWEASLRSAFGGRFEWLVSYVYSRARSNAVVDFTPGNPILGPQAGGPLSWDAPHRLLAWGWTPLPANFGPSWMRRFFRDMGLASLIETRSGFPFSVYNEEGVRVGPPNDRRFPAYFSINLHAEKKLRLWGYLWALRAGYNNLTNHGNPNVVNNNIDSPFFLAYGGGQRRATNVRLRFLGRK